MTVDGAPWPRVIALWNTRKIRMMRPMTDQPNEGLDEDLEAGEVKLLRSQGIRAVVLALFGLVVVVGVLGFNVIAIFTAPAAIVMATKILRYSKAPAFRTPRILAWVAIVLAALSLARQLLGLIGLTGLFLD